MKRIVSGALCAAVLAGFSSNAAAVPIYFDFTGSISGATGSYAGLEGSTVSGGFAFNTEDLTPFISPYSALAQFYEWPIASSQAHLEFGTSSISYPIYPQDNIASILFFDTDCQGLLYCVPVSEYREGFELNATSRDVEFDTWANNASYFGQVHEASMTVASYNFDGNFDAIDWDAATPIDIVSAPLLTLGGTYQNFVHVCSGQLSCSFDNVGGFDFSIDAVTRGIGSREVAVPEPGTLALMALGLAGMLLIRRRSRDLRAD